MAGNKYIALNVDGSKTEVAASQSSAGAGDAGKIVALDSGGKLDNSLMPTGIGAETKSITASEALAAGDWVNIYNATGTSKCRKADASSGKRAHGFVLAAVNQDATATVYMAGINNQLTSLTADSMYFLSATPGAGTVTAPTTAGYLVQELGISLSTTEVAFQPGQPITRA